MLWGLQRGYKGPIKGLLMIHCKMPCVAAKLYRFCFDYRNGRRKNMYLEKTIKSCERVFKALEGSSRLPIPLRILLRASWALISLKGLIWPGG